jgi:hypothetical protein
MIKFIGMKTRRGKKDDRTVKSFCVLHDTRFVMRRWVELGDEFVVLTGLHDPKIREVVKRSLLENYGITVQERSDNTKPDVKFVKPIEKPGMSDMEHQEEPENL